MLPLLATVDAMHNQSTAAPVDWLIVDVVADRNNLRKPGLTLSWQRGARLQDRRPAYRNQDPRDMPLGRPPRARSRQRKPLGPWGHNDPRCT